MPSVRLRGLGSATKRLSSGKVVTYWYAWRGGPRLVGAPGSAEFLASYQKAIIGRVTPKTDTLAALVGRYKASPEWARTADSTKREWTRWLDRISERDGARAIGSFTYASLSDPDCRADLLEWRDQWAAAPRSADYAVQVLSRVLSWGENRRLLKINAAAGIVDLYVNSRADQVWTEDERARFIIGAPSTEVAYIVELACLTGLRRGDLAALLWSEVGETAIVKRTSKSRERNSAVIPILPETKQLLAAIREHRPATEHVLTNTWGDPWTPSGLSHAVTAFGGKRLHDCRGTFATRLRLAGLTAAQIASVLGWEGERVERILNAYVDQNVVALALAAQVAKNENGA